MKDEYLPVMEGSLAEPVRQTSDSSAMALISAVGAASHAPQDSLKASESLITNLVHLDLADLPLPCRHSPLTAIPSMDHV